MRKWLPFIAAAALIAVGAFGGPIKSWFSGDIITSGDLNGNFEHIHNTMVGGHGARLTNADVSTSANIASSKLAGGAGIAVGWASVDAVCTADPCTAVEAYNMTVGATTTGVYTGYFTNSQCTGGTCAVFITSRTQLVNCYQNGKAAGNVDIRCFSAVDAGATNAAFDVAVFNR